MGALSKAHLVEVLHEEVAMTRAEAKVLVEALFETIRQTLESGQHVKLSGFGNFILRDKVSRPGRNPKTKQAVTVDARRVVTFKAGLKLKSTVENQGS